MDPRYPVALWDFDRGVTATFDYGSEGSGAHSEYGIAVRDSNTDRVTKIGVIDEVFLFGNIVA
jgi:Pyruvate/2-oxoacid:ferredoxin oxidoreductase gamma subunit